MINDVSQQDIENIGSQANALLKARSIEKLQEGWSP